MDAVASGESDHGLLRIAFTTAHQYLDTLPDRQASMVVAVSKAIIPPLLVLLIATVIGRKCYRTQRSASMV